MLGFKQSGLKSIVILLMVWFAGFNGSAQNSTFYFTNESQIKGKNISAVKSIVKLCVQTQSRITINGRDSILLASRDTVRIYFRPDNGLPDSISIYDGTNKKNKLIFRASANQAQKECTFKLVNINLSDKVDIASYSLAASSILNIDNDMMLVKGSTFSMGITDTADVEGGEDERPQHKVTLNSFYISKYEVTQALWIAVMDTNPSSHKDCYSCPVDNVSWNEAQLFLNKLNKMTKFHYRLPTEAEWEYAAKGGINSKGFLYSGSNDINEVAWYYTLTGSHQVGTKKFNELGLYDMTGNVSEWCSDWYGPYTKGQIVNPQGPTQGTLKTLRGGNWLLRDEGSIVTMRGAAPQNYHDQFIGLRLVKDAK